MSPAARLKHARHALAGLLVPAAWLALAGAARADEADAPATTTTTEAPATTTTTAAPVTTTTAPVPKQFRKVLAAAADAEAMLAGLGGGDGGGTSPAASPVATGPATLVTAAIASRPAPPSISVDDVLAAFPPRFARPDRRSAGGAGPSADPTTPGAPAADPGPFGVPTGDGPASGPPATAPGMAFVPSPAPAPSTGWPGLVSGVPAPVVDPAVGAAIGGAPAAVTGGAPSSTGQGENPERGPPAAAIDTGNANATGNQTVTTIDQSTLVVVTRRGTVSLTTADNRDTGATWQSATLPSGLLGGTDPRLLTTYTGARLGDGTVTITTGDATALGNWSSTTINQSTVVVVTAKKQDVLVDQPASVANVGTAAAGTGSNTALGSGNDGNGTAVITTGNAVAYGNRSTTVINQDTTVVITGSRSSVRVEQSADVDNIGTATATTGGNTATGTTGSGDGGAVIATGDATAVGNQSSTTITQNSTAVVTGGKSTVSIDQQANVKNVGTATASTGGNAAVATSGGGTGSVLITTGDASATGNQAGTTITQNGISVASGKFAGISVTQGVGVVNNGTAVATTGSNTAVGAG
jgi:hypothetical protein